MISCLVAKLGVSALYSFWVAMNLFVMWFYAVLGQQILMLKNIICGWLAISPLLGAWFWTETIIRATTSTTAVAATAAATVTIATSILKHLAVAGFPMQVAREILKDIEDVNVDHLGNKQTVPMVISTRASHLLAYFIVGCNIGWVVFHKIYWNIFATPASYIPIFGTGVSIYTFMCLRAAFLPIQQGQTLLKKSFYVLLSSMIGALLLS